MLRHAIAIWGTMLASVVPAVAADFTVEMHNKGADGIMVFEPPLTRIAVGDTVTFNPIDKGHNAETIPGFLPDGAEPFKGQISQPISVTFTVTGIYGVKCLPHFVMGMAALVVVGDVSPEAIQAAAAVNLPPPVKKRLDPLFAEIAMP